MKKYVYATFLFFILTALTGIWMRAYLLSPTPWIDYDHILHAHSHLALLGWIFIGAFIIFLSLYWEKIESRKHALVILAALVISSLLMFFAFLYQGYGVFSIALSTIHIWLEYWAGIFILRQLKKQVVPKSAKLFMIGGVIALFISSIGPYALAVISATGNKELPIFDMAVYFYLHFQYNGWLTMFLIGLFIIILSNRTLRMKESLARLAFWIYFIVLFPSYLLSVLWADLGFVVELIAAISIIGQWISVIVLLVSLKDSFKQMKSTVSKLTWMTVLLTFILLFIKSTLELGMIHPGLADMVNTTRSVIIGYLHLTLLGFISIFILVQYQLQGLTMMNRFYRMSFSIFFAGFVLNEILLFLQALGEWTNFYKIPFYGEGLLIAAVLLGIGVIMMSFTVSPSVAEKYAVDCEDHGEKVFNQVGS